MARNQEGGLSGLFIVGSGFLESLASSLLASLGEITTKLKIGEKKFKENRDLSFLVLLEAWRRQ